MMTKGVETIALTHINKVLDRDAFVAERLRRVTQVLIGVSPRGFESRRMHLVFFLLLQVVTYMETLNQVLASIQQTGNSTDIMLCSKLWQKMLTDHYDQFSSWLKTFLGLLLHGGEVSLQKGIF